MREIRQSGSEGGAGQTNASFLPRSDTFVIRAYGEAADGSRAWCEAVVQRVSEPVSSAPMMKFGRQFKQIRFRWLSPAEI